MLSHVIQPKKIRVALAVFDDVEDLVRAIGRLQAAGIGTGDLWIGANTETRARIDAIAGTDLPVTLLGDGQAAVSPSPARAGDVAFWRWAAEQACLPARTGGTLLATRIAPTVRLLTVSELLLSSGARVVELHDLPEPAASV